MARTFRRDPHALEKGKTFRDGHLTFSHTPGWWVKLYMNRPKRRKNARLCNRVLKGHDPESIAWPVGNRKPHEWYW